MKMNKILPVIGLMVLILVLFSSGLAAQCPMCKMSAESNMQGGGNFGKGLNAGIFYMLATPYLLVGTIGFIWWKNRKKSYNDENSELV